MKFNSILFCLIPTMDLIARADPLDEFIEPCICEQLHLEGERILKTFPPKFHHYIGFGLSGSIFEAAVLFASKEPIEFSHVPFINMRFSDKDYIPKSKAKDFDRYLIDLINSRKNKVPVIMRVLFLGATMSHFFSDLPLRLRLKLIRFHLLSKDGLQTSFIYEKEAPWMSNFYVEDRRKSMFGRPSLVSLIQRYDYIDITKDNDFQLPSKRNSELERFVQRLKNECEPIVAGPPGQARAK